MSIARVIEIGDVTAGIAVPAEPGTVRFYAAERPFDPLERRIFRSVGEVARAVGELVARRSRPKQPPSERRDAGRTADLVLAAPGPFPQAH